MHNLHTTRKHIQKKRNYFIFGLVGIIILLLTIKLFISTPQESTSTDYQILMPTVPPEPTDAGLPEVLALDPPPTVLLKPYTIQQFKVQLSTPTAPENIRTVLTKSGKNGEIADVPISKTVDETNNTLIITTQSAIEPSTTYHLIIEGQMGALITDTTYKSLAN